MASVAEVKAIAARMRQEFEELRGQVDGMRNIVNRLGGEAQNVLAESSQETAQAVIACAHGAETAMDDAIANLGLAVENLERFGAGL
jgi:ferritin-like metal-binding protein YciE